MTLLIRPSPNSTSDGLSNSICVVVVVSYSKTSGFCSLEMCVYIVMYLYSQNTLLLDLFNGSILVYMYLGIILQCIQGTAFWVQFIDNMSLYSYTRLSIEILQYLGQRFLSSSVQADFVSSCLPVNKKVVQQVLSTSLLFFFFLMLWHRVLFHIALACVLALI